MKKIKVLLTDPRHHTVGLHSRYVPVGIGYIAAYMLEKIKSQNFEVKLSINPDEIFDLIDEWKPNIIGSSNYIWNADLSYRMCEYAKEKLNDVLCVLGGPEFPSGSGLQNLTNTINNNCYEYLKSRPHIDYYCYNDGEPAFSKVVQEYINNNFSVKEMKEKNLVVNGSMSLSSDKKRLLVGNPVNRLGLKNKVDGLDIIPSPYLTGLLDKYLNGKYIPSFETARGCPFLCTFCDIGLDRNKIVSFSTKRMCDELDYVVERMSKFPSGTKVITFFDSNWGLYQKDVVLSDHILKIIKEKDWPTSIEIATAKNKKQQILDIDEKLKNRVQITLSQQSMNRETLDLIKRDNMSNDKYIDFMKELEIRGKNPVCELIIPLPNESKQTYLDNVKLLMNYGVNVGTYTLMLLKGAELGREEDIKKYGLKSAWRIVPRDFGTYRGKKIFDVERVCVASDTMPYKDFIQCRKFSFLVEVFSYSIFFPFRKLYKELNIPFFEFLWAIFNKLESKDNTIPKEFSEVYYEFAKECEEELFESKEAIYGFYSKEENYKKLLTSELGDNLLRKYSAKIVYRSMNQAFDFCTDLINELLPKGFKDKNEIQNILDSYKLWLKNLYILNSIFNWEQKKKNETVINLEYDIPQWYKSKDASILNYKKKINYKMTYNEKNEKLRNELIGLHGDKDKIFTLGKFFHTTQSQNDVIEKTPIEI